jgi:phthalate 4,5-cis-dihydrodiol dehydrogenase
VQPIRLGVIGLGRAFTLMLPTFVEHPLIALVAASDSRDDARTRFAREFGASVYDDAKALCADATVDAVYVASPHQFHAEHVKLAARHRKHILVEKPMALTVAECQEMIAAAKAAGVQLLVGHSHSYDLPYLRTRELIASQRYGAIRMVNALNFTDFLYRPRRPEELDTRAGGGVIFSQGAHQIDIVRLLVGKPARSVRALVGRWDPDRPAEGAYSAQLRFDDDVFASITYSGYGHFDTDEFNDWVGELGQRRNPEDYGAARMLLRQAASADAEIALKNRRAYGPAGLSMFQRASALDHNHFGFVIASCERADLRPMPEKIVIYGDHERWTEPLMPPKIARSEVVDELHAAVALGQPPLHSGEWGLATLEICLAILQSAQEQQEVRLLHQI